MAAANPLALFSLRRKCYKVAVAVPISGRSTTASNWRLLGLIHISYKGFSHTCLTGKFVVVGSKLSETTTMISSVLHDSVLGPLLFLPVISGVLHDSVLGPLLFLPVISGVRHDSVLGPLLFLPVISCVLHDSVLGPLLFLLVISGVPQSLVLVPFYSSL